MTIVTMHKIDKVFKHLKMVIGVMSTKCPLCEKEKPLILSHIIPKCLYDKRQGRLIGIDASTKFNTNPNIQNGYKERLLCAECDNKIGILDKYAKNFLYTIVPNSATDRINGFDIYDITPDNFDYKKLYKFFVSILWRYSISSTKASLGKYEQIAFDILTDKTPIQPDLFLPIICKKEINHPSNTAVGISKGRFAGTNAYCFKIPGYEITIVINTKHSSSPTSLNIYKTYFCENGVKVIKMKTLSEIDKQLSNKIELNKKLYKKSHNH